MESLKIDNLINTFRSKNIVFFTNQDLKQLFPNISRIGISVAIKRLIKTKTISRLERGKFQFLLSKIQPNEYTTANFIYQPSYISLETALSLYGVIDQFTYQITSITTKKAKTKTYSQKEYSYSHIDKKFFTDYRLQDNYLIASLYKALFDYFYLTLKGLKSKNNINLINLTDVQKKEFIDYVDTYHMPKFSKFVKNNL